MAEVAAASWGYAPPAQTRPLRGRPARHPQGFALALRAHPQSRPPKGAEHVPQARQHQCDNSKASLVAIRQQVSTSSDAEHHQPSRPPPCGGSLAGGAAPRPRERALPSPRGRRRGSPLPSCRSVDGGAVGWFWAVGSVQAGLQAIFSGRSGGWRGRQRRALRGRIFSVVFSLARLTRCSSCRPARWPRPPGARAGRLET